MARVQWIDYDGGLDRAVELTKEILYDHSVLLTFAHGYHVAFGPALICYEGIGTNRRQSSIRGFMWRFGIPGIRPLNIFPEGIETYLRHCVPLMRNMEFLKKTQVKRAMIWYNSVECFESVFETHFAFLWTALEILAGAHAECENNLELQSASMISEIRAEFSKLLEELNVCQIDSWVRKLSKYTLAIDRANELLRKYGLSQYEHELGPLYKLRNDIVHGHSFQISKEEVNKRFKLRRIIEKLILKILGFYDRRNCIHSAITMEDLLAVS
jgi:hypothetical protein